MSGRFCSLNCVCQRHNGKSKPKLKCEPDCQCGLHWRPKHIIISGVYIIRNNANNKKYIGSSLDVYKRFSYHQSSLKQGINKAHLMQHEYNVYGKETFSYDILEFFPKDTEAFIFRSREQYWLEMLSPEYNTKQYVDYDILEFFPKDLGRNV